MAKYIYEYQNWTDFSWQDKVLNVVFGEVRFIILLNGFQKKSQKTPRNEIELAEKLKKQYFNEKPGK